ncbi:MAG: S8 family peptidase [Bdellovibrio sp.]|nr:S8 family peptidase [Bdellovibrio sp.]
MKKIAFLILTLTGVAYAGSDRYVIEGDLDLASSSVKKVGGQVSHKLKYHRALIAHLSDGQLKSLKQITSSLAIERDGMVEVQGKPTGGSTTQPPESVPWGIGHINSQAAWATSTGLGSIVCVVDTGVQRNHPDLETNVMGGENFVVSRGFVDPNKWDDDNGHGTHVAGTIAALDNEIGVVGVAPQASIFAAKVLDRRGSGYNSDIAEGIRSCISHGAHVINMSLGGPSDSSILKSAVQEAYAAGLVVVAAAGNESGPVSYPAKYSEVIAVSAIDSSNKLAYFSNFGPEVDFAAPGVSVTSTTKGSSYATYNGTSMASPHVAGVAALMLSSGLNTLKSRDIGLSSASQGQGLIDALLSVTPEVIP